jgi:orotidine-5'-phosphate decarboxylase
MYFRLPIKEELMFFEKYNYFKEKNDSVLCVGLDSDINKVKSDQFDFNKNIIDSTKDYVCAYKLNIAFYEEAGEKGVQALQNTIEYIKKFDLPIILDVKRGDISNTAKAYARAYFKNLKVDSITLTPYMGEDSILPYLEIKNSHLFIVALSSNKGAMDFEIPDSLYLRVVGKASQLNKIYKNRVGIVVGATQNAHIQNILNSTKELLWLVPGIGAQGGDAEKFFLACNGYDDIVVNSSRKIIFSNNPKMIVKETRDRLNTYRRKYGN